MAHHSVQSKKRGKLKIFFGYAEGVGKTSAMLNAAHDEQRDGADVVAGFIETHGRPETAVLLNGLEQLPVLELRSNAPSHRDREFNLDQALRRQPQLILVDELAHLNAAGCRHKKRYQDIEELLRAGINVYTTINVQHIESLHDVVTAITGISVHERIPDSVFDGADQIELVDIPPDDLLERLSKGKLAAEGLQEPGEPSGYPPVFVRTKLIALREIALRYTADQQGRITRESGSRSGEDTYPTADHILVCLSSAASSKKVIRTAARMAEAFRGPFTALYVETPKSKELTAKSKAELRDNLRLAEQLGAQPATVYGDDVPGQIAEYAVSSRVTKIVIGRSRSGKKRWITKGNLIDKLTELAPNIDIHIIPDNQPARYNRSSFYVRPQRFSLPDALKTLGILAVCTLIGLWFQYLGFREANMIIVYILGVLLNAIVTSGRLYSAVNSVLSVLVFNYLFTEPYYSLVAADSGYPVTFLVMLTASFISSTLTTRIKEQARQNAQKAYRTEVLLETSRILQQAEDAEAIINETAVQMVKLVDRTVIFYPAGTEGLAGPLVYPKPEAVVDPSRYTGTNEWAVADWVYKNNKRAGATTDTFSAASCLYHAVRAGETVFAVAAVVMDQEEPLGIFEKSLMIAMLGECALALEKEQLSNTQKEISIQIRQEQLRANLLRGISHDLRTPLTSISGNAGILMANSNVLSEAQLKGLYTDIYDDSMWLINLVENLLSITRIDNGSLNLNFQAELLDEVITEALLHVNRSSVEHNIQVRLEDELLMARMDSRLIIQVLINLVDNAIKYTQTGSRIILSARREQQAVRVSVADDGPGISEEAKAKLFEMFYTADNLRGDGRRGLGLGLSLCKSIVHAHGGTIEVMDNNPQGAVFTFTLQAEEVNVLE
ncbi:sensor histidine kinase KdpD [Paenibacillus sp. FSL R7-0273]|uniref:sensor histidine kinase n=1 Tax=Paenibacillus sp. FSL R7-0273 TaxID=1536772 RepID=UPI00063F4B4D|nr:sensor histidine kinase KdpD [Paenibacillus sp. FSL R7-0273]OMF91518.1 histidine kinase [Paenibacillus sp. FSL R7-0273]